jgi:NAD-dependent dihydropyrimidine dehydrogenase PreA subunit
MSILFLDRYKFSQWLKKIHETYLVYYPDFLENKIHYRKLTPEFFSGADNSMHKALQEIRPTQALKGFFFNPRLKVGGLDKDSKVNVKLDESPRVIIGAKNCDLRPLMVHQKMYLENEYGDAFYKSQLDRTIIIAADCPAPKETCFCNLVGLKPYPEKGADIILTTLPHGYIFESATKKGEEFLHGNNHMFQEASAEDLQSRDEQRKQTIAVLDKINPKKLRDDLPKAIDEKTEAKFWQEHADKCVECFGCLMVCPTCFCFLLYDTPTHKESFERHKIWDACYYAAYARVGGGMQDRAEFWKRFRNRFHCKFMHFKNKYDFYACSGCGRCYSVCMGKIDIRKVLEKV